MGKTTLDSALESFENDPSEDSAHQLITTAQEYTRAGMIGITEFSECLDKALECLRGERLSLRCARKCIDALSEGWGADEEEKAAKEIEPIIRDFYMKQKGISRG